MISRFEVYPDEPAKELKEGESESLLDPEFAIIQALIASCPSLDRKAGANKPQFDIFRPRK